MLLTAGQTKHTVSNLGLQINLYNTCQKSYHRVVFMDNRDLRNRNICVFGFAFVQQVHLLVVFFCSQNVIFPQIKILIC